MDKTYMEICDNICNLYNYTLVMKNAVDIFHESNIMWMNVMLLHSVIRERERETDGRHPLKEAITAKGCFVSGYPNKKW